jgi:membrane-associated protein
MSGVVDHVLNAPAAWIYIVVGLLVFAEDALFVGFVLPGETAAVLGGVAASRDRVSLAGIVVVVVAAAIIGDSVGYEVGHRYGRRILQLPFLRKHSERLDAAQRMLARRGGWAVFLGRYVAFFRAVMPALAGTAHMPYRKFLSFNAAGGIVWGTGVVLLGYLAGDSYKHVEKVAGRGAAVTVAALVVVAVVVWRLRERRREGV